MDGPPDDAFIEALPKVELHLHIEGSFEPELMFHIAQRNSAPIRFHSVDEVRKAYQFGNLQDFLDIYYQGMGVLLKEQDFYDLTIAYFERVHRDGVVHAEIFFDPQGHTDRGVSFETAVVGITRAMKDAESRYLITSYLILSILRHLSQEAALQTLAQAKPFMQHFVAVGLDSSEMGHPPSKFAEAYRVAREMGMKCVAHAGEEGPAEYVQEALDVLKCGRIDHGNHAADNPALVQRLARERIGLTMCPLSNYKLQGCPDLTKHPAKILLQQGVLVSINSDDPAYFGGYIGENYKAIAKALNLTRGDLVRIAIASVESSFLPDATKAAHRQRIEAFAAAVASAATGDRSPRMHES